MVVNPLIGIYDRGAFRLLTEAIEIKLRKKSRGCEQFNFQETHIDEDHALLITILLE